MTNTVSIVMSSSFDKKPVAWSYELADVYDEQTKTYSNWRKCVSFNKPNVSVGSIRNLKPLYE